MPDSRILVIGCGFIGSNVVEELAGASRPPVVLSRSRPEPEVAAKIDPADLIVGDAAEAEVVERALDGVGHVIFSAGGLLPAASEEDPERDEELTLGPVRAVLAALRERPGVGLAYLSSGGTVYGEPEENPVREDAPTEPLGAYGRLHLRCEDEVLAASREHGLRSTILRCATVYGEHQHPNRGQGAVVTFLHRIEHGEPIDLYGGGTTIRDYVYAGDVAKAAIALIGRDGPAVINVGSGEGTSLIDLLRLVEREVGREAQVRQHGERGFEVHQIVLDTTRLHQTVELEITDLPAGIARTHGWLAARGGRG
ncbi:MAG TPA: NAD-dependent epimerase/dehydratase family protein [Solirubrobacterales bacterium]|nr:NAD-dependent epimerase/dehydratase family protein [Solirubrobacterales bacterium]